MEGSPGSGLPLVGERLLTGAWSIVKATAQYTENCQLPDMERTRNASKSLTTSFCQITGDILAKIDTLLNRRRT